MLKLSALVFIIFVFVNILSELSGLNELMFELPEEIKPSDNKLHYNIKYLVGIAGLLLIVPGIILISSSLKAYDLDFPISPQFFFLVDAVIMAGMCSLPVIYGAMNRNVYNFYTTGAAFGQMFVLVYIVQVLLQLSGFYKSFY